MFFNTNRYTGTKFVTHLYFITNGFWSIVDVVVVTTNGIIVANTTLEEICWI